MTLLIGTRDGLYRAENVPFEGTERVLSGGGVPAIAVGEDVFVVLDGDVYRSPDGERFGRVRVTTDRVRTVTVGPAGKVYAGSDPSRLFLSGDGGDNWTELDGLQDVPSRSGWEKRGGQDAVTAVAVPDALPRRIVVGVEPAGVHISDDGGATFQERRYGVHDDVHQLLVESPREYLAATGDGLYRTGDAGRTWVRLDTDHTYFEYTYFQAATVHDGEWFAGAAAGAPGSWGEAVDAGLFASSDGDSFERILLPVDGEFVVCFGEYDGTLLSGTLSHDLATPGTDPAHVLQSEQSNWEVVGETPAGVWALAQV
jgi:hypothetical protein